MSADPKETRRVPRLVDLRAGRAARRLVGIDADRAGESTRIEALAGPLTADDVLSCDRPDELRRDAALLAMALRDPEDPAQPWGTEEQILDRLTAREVKLLLDQVAAHQLAVSPPTDSMSARDIHALIDRVQDEDKKRLYLDSFRAGRARELAAYYDEPASKITDGQVWNFIALLNTYNAQMHEANEKQRDAEEQRMAASHRSRRRPW